MENALILDDRLAAWSKEYLKNIIVSKFYNPLFNEKQLKAEKFKNYNNSIVIQDYQMDLEEFSGNFCDNFFAPFSLEYDYTIKSQLLYLIETFENIYKITTLLNCKDI